MLNNLPLKVFKSLGLVFKFSSEAMVTMDPRDFLKFVLSIRLFAVLSKLGGCLLLVSYARHLRNCEIVEKGAFSRSVLCEIKRTLMGFMDSELLR